MAKKKLTSQKNKNTSRDSVFKEAWKNMNEDFKRFMPERFRNREKKKFVLWLILVELIVIGVFGKFLYDWLIR